MKFENVIKLTYFCFVFVLFWPKIIQKKFKSNKFRLNSTRAFDWYINCHIWLKINFGPFLPIRGDPYQKKVEIFGHDPIFYFGHDPIFFLGHDRFGPWQIWVMTGPGHDRKIKLDHDRFWVMTQIKNWVMTSTRSWSPTLKII